MAKRVPKSFPTEYLTPQELCILGTLTDTQREHPYRPLAFLTCPVGPNSVRIVNNRRQQTRSLELKLVQAALNLQHNLYMRLHQLDASGNTLQDPTFMGPRLREGRVVLEEDERLTAEIYERLESYGSLVIPRRSTEGMGPNPERM